MKLRREAGANVEANLDWYIIWLSPFNVGIHLIAAQGQKRSAIVKVPPSA
jgi:hypothetical protein